MPRARYPGQRPSQFLSRVNRRWNNKHHSAMFNRRHGRTWHSAGIARRTATSVYRRYRRAGGRRSFPTRMSSRGSMRANPILRAPIARSQAFERIVLKSRDDILISGDAITTKRATLRYLLNQSKVDGFEYTNFRNMAQRYREIRYTGTTVVVQYLTSTLYTESTVPAPGDINWNQMPCNVYINLDYKHDLADLANPSWPGNITDTVRIPKGGSAKKTFKIPRPNQSMQWAAVNSVFPAAPTAANGPLFWANTVEASTRYTNKEVNEALLITLDNIPHLSEFVSADDAQVFDCMLQIKAYHHFVLRTPLQVA